MEGSTNVTKNNGVNKTQQQCQVSSPTLELSSDETKIRKPSYVGLSCTVSGYSDYINYTSPVEGKTPLLIPVNNPPQTLDFSSFSIGNSFENMRQNGTSNHSSEALDGSVRSPKQSYTSPVSTKPGSPGNLVQRQIERLYGGKAQTVRGSRSSEGIDITSPIQNEKHLHTETNKKSPVPSSPTKVPAVFKLLRPEFQEQLKNNSCQIPTDQTVPSPKAKTINNNVDRSSKKEITSNENTPNNHLINSSVNKTNSDDQSKEFNANEINQNDQQTLLNHSSNVSEISDNNSDLLEEYEVVGGVHELSQLSTIVEEEGEGLSDSQNSAKKESSEDKDITNGIVKETTDSSASEEKKEIQDGHYFIRLLENEIFKFEEQICDFEEDLNNDSISGDIRDSILAAIGKARLLMAQKLAQFRGLCDKNITQNVEEDPFVPTPQDLAGFWDMVYIQVEHIHSLFAELSTIKKNGWIRPEPLKKQSAPKTPDKKPKSTKSVKTSPKTVSDATKARNEARRKMIEEKRRQMRQKKTNEENDNNFVQF